MQHDFLLRLQYFYARRKTRGNAVQLRKARRQRHSVTVNVPARFELRLAEPHHTALGRERDALVLELSAQGRELRVSLFDSLRFFSRWEPYLDHMHDVTLAAVINGVSVLADLHVRNLHLSFAARASKQKSWSSKLPYQGSL